MILKKAALTATVVLVALLGACSRHAPDSSAASGPAATTAATAPAAAVAPAGSTKAPAQVAGVESSTITRINEDGSETVEDTSSDSKSNNALLTAVAASISGTAAAATTLAAPTPWQEGVNYTRLVPAQPTSAPAGQVEVIEFFWYSCPHCNAIDPLVEAWRRKLPSYVTFSREHVMWQEMHRQQARLFYTLQSLGKVEELHSLVFREIHVNNNPLVDTSGMDPAKTEDIQAAFVAKHGISASEFRKAYHSFAVETAMQRGDQLWNRYHISGVPTFVVNGKYIADVGTARGEEQLLSLVADLAALEHKR